VVDWYPRKNHQPKISFATAPIFIPEGRSKSKAKVKPSQQEEWAAQVGHVVLVMGMAHWHRPHALVHPHPASGH